MNKLKIFSVFLFFILSFTISTAQYFEGGFIFGFTVSQIDGDTYAGYHQPGLTGGFYTSREILRNMKGQLELKYSAKGARETGGKDNPMLYEQKLRYIELPVKVKYFMKKYKTDLELGICPGYLANEIINYNYSTINYDESNNKFELSWCFGGSYHINDHLIFSCLLNYSLLPIRRYENSDFNYGFLSRAFLLNKGDYNNVLSFLLYYKLGGE